jgi:predicted membrane channel-forming protein YqfA (hemolysin III family)
MVMKILRVISFVFMALGVLLYLVGILFKIQHWPDMFKGQISGLIIALIGIVFFLISLIKKQDKNAL